MALGKRKPKQASLWVDASHLRAHGSHPFYRRLNEILERANFDDYAERICRKYYAPTLGRPSIALPLLLDRLLRGNRLGARHRLPGLGLAQPAGVLGAEPGGADAGPLDAVQDAAAAEPGDAQGGVPLGVAAEGRGGVRKRIAGPERKRQRWAGQRAAQAAVYANRRRLQTEAARARMRRRGERLERSFAHLHETGGMRRVHLRGKSNIAKRLLIHAAAFNLSLILRQLLRAGTARQAAELLTAVCFCILRLMYTANRGPLVVGPRWPTARTAHPPRSRHRWRRRQSEALSTGC